MDIPNLSSNPQNSVTPLTPLNRKKSKGKFVVPVIIVLAIGLGFLLSRLMPLSSSNKSLVDNITQKSLTSADELEDASDIIVGESYGETGKTFTDTATGIIVAGGINGEGTHTLEREGGDDQDAALTSSVLDLDLFVGREVEIKGETNASTKAGWFLDVGVIKVLE